MNPNGDQEIAALKLRKLSNALLILSPGLFSEDKVNSTRVYMGINSNKY